MNDGVQIDIIDHTADVGLQVRAPDAPTAYAVVAEGMFDIMLDRSRVRPAEEWEVAVEATGREDLLVTWLEELLYLYETHRRALHSCTVQEISETRLRASVRGDALNREEHDPRVQIKAVTYHQLRAEVTEQGFEIRVIFDI